MKNTTNELIELTEAKARNSGQKEPVYRRIARVTNNLGDKIYIDLCDDKWRVVEVSEDGWKILEKSPVNFVRTGTMKAFPLPRQGSSIMEVGQFLNMDDSQLKLAIAWILGSLRGQGQCPVMVINGRTGTGKSTASKMLMLLVAPSRVPLIGPPHKPSNLAFIAVNEGAIAMDHLSKINKVRSDYLCRISSGGWYKPNGLPVLVNGIHELTTHTKLAERSIVLNLPIIKKWKDETTLWKTFEEALPGLFGGVVKCLSDCLKNEQTTTEKLKKNKELPPGMADFAIWGTAAEQSLGWERGEFLRILKKTQPAMHHPDK